MPKHAGLVPLIGTAAIIAMCVPLAAVAHDGGAQSAHTKAKSPDNVCAEDEVVPNEIVANPNIYIADCLGLTRLRDYDKSALNMQLNLGSDSSFAEVGMNNWIYLRKPAGGEHFSFQSIELRAAALIPLDKGTKDRATFADLTKAKPFNRLGFEVGFQFRSAPVDQTINHADNVIKMLTAAQEACEKAGKEPKDCTGLALHDWIREGDRARRNTYYNMFAPGLWGHKIGRHYYVDGEFRLAPYKYAYYPVIDPANTGEALLGGLPFDAAGNIDKNLQRSVKGNDYSVALRAGYSGNSFGALATASYRREFEVPKGGANRVLCPPSTPTGAICDSYNIAPGLQKSGAVLGVGVRYRPPDLPLIPALGLAVNLSYALDVEQFGVEVPIYFMKPKGDDAHGGVRLNCTTKAHLKTGAEVDGECGVSVFIGASFSLGK